MSFVLVTQEMIWVTDTTQNSVQTFNVFLKARRVWELFFLYNELDLVCLFSILLPSWPLDFSYWYFGPTLPTALGLLLLLLDLYAFCVFLASNRIVLTLIFVK